MTTAAPLDKLLPQKERELHDALLKAAEAHKLNDLSARLLLRTAVADPQNELASTWQAAREQLGVRDCFLLQGSDHALVAWVSLPTA